MLAIGGLATTGDLVGYESWLERDRLLLLDFDPDVVGIVSQPFWLFWTAADGKARSHVPDYFARLADGSALVLDCRPVNRIKSRDRAAFDATLAACDLLGLCVSGCQGHCPPKRLPALKSASTIQGSSVSAQPPSRCNDAHSASTAPTSAAGAVSNPSMVNSPSFATWLCWCSTFRHSMVAREPA